MRDPEVPRRIRFFLATVENPLSVTRRDLVACPELSCLVIFPDFLRPKGLVGRPVVPRPLNFMKVVAVMGTSYSPPFIFSPISGLFDIETFLHKCW